MIINIAIVGDSNVGKTTLAYRYCYGSFNENIAPTIRGCFFKKDVVVKKAQHYLQIWDTAGQEKFKSLAPQFYKNADFIIVCFECNSVLSAEEWLQQIQKNCAAKNEILLCGTKTDLFSAEKREEKVHFCSAKTGEGISELFGTILERISGLEAEKARKNVIEAQKPGCC